MRQKQIEDVLSVLYRIRHWVVRYLTNIGASDITLKEK